MVKTALYCTAYGKSSKIMDPYYEEDFRVNTRSMLAAKAIGKGRNGLATFAGMMGRPLPFTRPKISQYNEVIRKTASLTSYH